MTGYAVLRFSDKPIKRLAHMRGLQAHNARHDKYLNSDKAKNIIKENTHLNKSKFILNNTKEIFKDYKLSKVQERLNDCDTIRNDSVKCVEVVMQASHDFMHSLNYKDQYKYLKDCIEFLESEFGKKNVVNWYFHFDERTPHLHAYIVPVKTYNKKYKDGTIKEKNVLSKKHYFGHENSYAQYQTKLAKFLQEKGWKIERGQKESKATHIQTAEFSKAVSKLFKKYSTIFGDKVKLDDKELTRLVIQSFETAKIKNEYEQKIEILEKAESQLQKSEVKTKEKAIKLDDLILEQERKINELNKKITKYERITQEHIDAINNMQPEFEKELNERIEEYINSGLGHNEIKKDKMLLDSFHKLPEKDRNEVLLDVQKRAEIALEAAQDAASGSQREFFVKQSNPFKPQ